MESVASGPFRVRVTLTHRDPNLVRAQGTQRSLGPQRTSFLCFQRAPTLGQRIVRCRFEVLLLLAVIAMHPRHSENNGPRFAVRTRRGAAAPPSMVPGCGGLSAFDLLSHQPAVRSLSEGRALVRGRTLLVAPPSLALRVFPAKGLQLLHSLRKSPGLPTYSA